MFGLMAVGFVNGGAGGLLGTIGAITTGKLISAILMGICTAVMTFNLLAALYLIQAVARHYWNRGGAEATGKDLAQAAAANPEIVQYALKTMA